MRNTGYALSTIFAFFSPYSILHSVGSLFYCVIIVLKFSLEEDNGTEQVTSQILILVASLISHVTVTAPFETQSPHLSRMCIIAHAYLTKSLQIRSNEIIDMKELQKWQSRFKHKTLYLERNMLERVGQRFNTKEGLMIDD